MPYDDKVKNEILEVVKQFHDTERDRPVSTFQVMGLSTALLTTLENNIIPAEAPLKEVKKKKQANAEE